jgi:DNA polymerase III alpha subunit (gram-positive type)
LILLAFDLETTGLDFVNDRPIEVGAILYSTGQQKCLESQGFLVKTDVAISVEITKLTGITQQAVDKFGYDSVSSLEIIDAMMDQADAVIGHNVVRFDKRMLYAWETRDNNRPRQSKLWIDTYTDLPDTEVGKLTLMAANAGFLNMFPHSALADCQTVLKLVEKYDILKVVERAKSPTIVVQAHQARHQNELAKKAKFRWFPEKKIWWKFCKEMDLEGFVKDLQFDVSVHRENIEEFQNL